MNITVYDQVPHLTTRERLQWTHEDGIPWSDYIRHYPERNGFFFTVFSDICLLHLNIYIYILYNYYDLPCIEGWQYQDLGRANVSVQV